MEINQPVSSHWRGARRPRRRLPEVRRVAALADVHPASRRGDDGGVALRVGVRRRDGKGARGKAVQVEHIRLTLG